MKEKLILLPLAALLVIGVRAQTPVIGGGVTPSSALNTGVVPVANGD